MTKQYNANKNRWYAMLLCNVPYPLPFEEEEVEQRRKGRMAFNTYTQAMIAAGVFPYFINR